MMQRIMSLITSAVTVGKSADPQFSLKDRDTLIEQSGTVTEYYLL